MIVFAFNWLYTTPTGERRSLVNKLRSFQHLHILTLMK